MTYTDMLNRLRIETSKTTLADADKERLTQFLNEGLEAVWALEPYKIMPWAFETSSPTLSSYKFARTEIELSDWFTVWSEDPRALYVAGTPFRDKLLRAARDETYVSVQATSSTATVWVAHSKALPSFQWDAVSWTGVIPDETARWLQAYVRLREMETAQGSASEQLIQRAMARLQRETDDLITSANATWQAAPWLDWHECYVNLAGGLIR